MKHRGAIHSLWLGFALVASTRVTGAQGYRLTGTTVSYLFELQPVRADSIADSLTTGAGTQRSSPVGIVGCPEGHTQCYFYRSEPTTHTVPLVQDLEVTGWGLGQGVSVYAHVRARANLSGETELWTRANDHFTTLAAYAEIDRDRWTARAGRVWLNSQLGLNNFDGASLAVRPRDGLSVEGYAGRALIEGLSEPFTSSDLASADVLPPDVGAVLLGVTARYRATQRVAFSAEYQRELRTDRAGLYSERMAFDALGSVDGIALLGEAQVDLASSAVNVFRVRASRPVWNRTSLGVEYLHSTPFFPLWTVWGVFAPVGFNEAHADAAWTSANNGVSLALNGGYRTYQNTHTGVGFLPLRDNGWTLVASGSWWVQPTWQLTGSYRRDIGFGAAKSDGNAGVRWQRDGGSPWLGITGSATQTIYEWVITNGYVWGASLDGGISLTPDVHLSAQAGVYRQLAQPTPATTMNWSQVRALLRLEWVMGGDPGMKP